MKKTNNWLVSEEFVRFEDLISMAEGVDFSKIDQYGDVIVSAVFLRLNKYYNLAQETAVALDKMIESEDLYHYIDSNDEDIYFRHLQMATPILKKIFRSYDRKIKKELALLHVKTETLSKKRLELLYRENWLDEIAASLAPRFLREIVEIEID